MSLSNFTSNEKLYLVQVKDSRFNEEIRRKDLGIDNSQALIIENRGRRKSRGRSRKSKDLSSPSLEESSTATIVVKKDTSNGIVRLGRTETRKIGEVKTRLMIKMPQPK